MPGVTLGARTRHHRGVRRVPPRPPEHPYPAALDAHAAWTWLRGHAAAERIVVGGQSAGGGLAAALVQRLYDEGERPRAQWLFCPMLDDRTAARRGLDDAGHRVWDNRLNRFGWRAYLGTEPGAPGVPPYAVPARRDDVAGLPDTWIGVGDIDLFHDEARESLSTPDAGHSTPV